jgi:hypothetical protein
MAVDPRTAQRRLRLEGNHRMAAASVTADRIQQRRSAHFCSLSQFQIADVLIRTARDGGYWPVSDDSGLVLKMAMI